MNEVNICSLKEIRREALRRTWKKLEEMDREGIPTFDAFGRVFREIYADLKRQAAKVCRVGAEQK